MCAYTKVYSKSNLPMQTLRNVVKTSGFLLQVGLVPVSWLICYFQFFLQYLGLFCASCFIFKAVLCVFTHPAFPLDYTEALHLTLFHLPVLLHTALPSVLVSSFSLFGN